MSLGPEEKQFMLHLLLTTLAKGNATDMSHLISEFLAQHHNLPPHVESLLVKYITDQSPTMFSTMARTAIYESWVDLNQLVILVAALVRNGSTSLTEAADLLDPRGRHIDGLRDVIRRVFDVAWQVNEDRRDGIMNPDQDDLLATALDAALDASIMGST